MIGLYSLLLGGWSLINYLRRRPPDGSFNGALAIAVGLYALEGLVGVALVLMGFVPPRWVHFLYGVTMMLTVPAIFAFTRGSNTTRESLLYGLGLLFIWGLNDRAAFTGH
jgi:heme A synthase